tara:strand:+ start:770 stop:1078 length:309 start_codon:yes stop_codon:yes gene_type:complete
MKLHPKAKAALRHLIDCEKSNDVYKIFSVANEIAADQLEKYAPEISARFDCINSQTIEEAECADAWFNYSYKEYMIQDHNDVKNVDVFHQIHLPNELNDIPF